MNTIYLVLEQILNLLHKTGSNWVPSRTLKVKLGLQQMLCYL